MADPKKEQQIFFYLSAHLRVAQKHFLHKQNKEG